MKDLIPKSDLFVLEEKMWTRGGIKSNMDMGTNLLTFQVNHLNKFLFILGFLLIYCDIITGNVVCTAQ